MSEIKVNIPAKLELKVIVTDGNGSFGEVTFELPSMRIPTKEEIIAAISECSASEVVQNNGFKVANQKETFDYICMERAGSTFAMPSDCGEWMFKE